MLPTDPGEFSYQAPSIPRDCVRIYTDPDQSKMITEDVWINFVGIWIYLNSTKTRGFVNLIFFFEEMAKAWHVVRECIKHEVRVVF